MHPLVTLAANATRGDRRYVCFAGAGLSRDAGLPTAWALMLKTAQLLRAKEEGDPSIEEDIQTWFLNSPYAKIRYDELVGGLFPTSVAQQAFLRKELHADEPGKAHRLIAYLAKLGVLRCVITTNFDDLIERALREEGLECQVITEENLDTSEPLIQCPVFRIYKPHGTIDSGRLRNTPEDLKQLHDGMERELVSIISDHGLIVLGYSGSDESIRRIFRQKRRYLYPTFWVHVDEVPQFDCPLFGNEPLHFVPCVGAAAFLDDLIAMYRRLDLMAPTGSLGVAAQSAEEAIRGEKRDARARVRRFWEVLAGEINRITPNLSKGPDDELFVQFLDQTIPAGIHFAKVAIAVSEMDDGIVANDLYKGFEHLLKGYFLPRGHGGHFDEYQFDSYKFLGHELFVTLFSSLIREDRWETIGKLLDQGIYMDNPSTAEAPALLPFIAMNEFIAILKVRSKRLNINKFLHSQILYQRHTEGEFAQYVPSTQFMEADLFLYLRSLAGLTDLNNPLMEWDPWSSLLLNRPPRYLLEATRSAVAERLCQALGVSNIGKLREVVAVAGTSFIQWRTRHGVISSATPLAHLDPQSLGSC